MGTLLYAARVQVRTELVEFDTGSVYKAPHTKSHGCAHGPVSTDLAYIADTGEEKRSRT